MAGDGHGEGEERLQDEVVAKATRHTQPMNGHQPSTKTLWWPASTLLMSACIWSAWMARRKASSSAALCSLISSAWAFARLRLGHHFQ